MEERDEITPSPDYVRGFNEGYTLAEHMPELAEQLSKAIGDAPRGQGFADGHRQFLAERERERDLRPEWLRPQSPGSMKEIDPLKDREDRDIEPER